MKKFLFILFLVLLSLSLSFNTFALGNSYVFSDLWNSLVFSEAKILRNNTTTVEGDLISSDGLVFTAGDVIDLGITGTHFKGVKYGYSAGSTSLTVSLPVNISVANEQNLSWQLFFVTPDLWDTDTVQISAYGIHGNTTYPISTSVRFGTNLKLYSPVYNSTGGVSGSTTVFSGNSCAMIDLSYTIATGTAIFDTIDITFNNLSSSSFVLGALGSLDTVSLPSDVVSMIKDISNNTNLTNSRLLSLINEIREMQTTLEDLLGSIGSNSSTTNNYYNQILNPSEDHSNTIAKLEQDLASAKEELFEIQEVINSVPSPTYDDLASANSDGISSSLSIIQSDVSQELFTSIFSKLDFLTGMILSVLAIATLGYVLFGKKV